MSYHQGMQKGNLDSVKADEHGKIKKETVDLKGVSVTRVTFDVGAKWSTDLKGYAGTNSCQLPHVALVLSGTLRVVMDDGSQQDFSKNDVMLLPPGHDAWSVGNEPCVFVEFSRGNDYYTGDHGLMGCLRNGAVSSSKINWRHSTRSVEVKTAHKQEN